jgi:hypothetical protein
MYHTVPVALHAWFCHPSDYRSAVTSAIACGGDADTTAAIVGGIVGAAVGKQGIPDEWLTGLWEWPRTNDYLDRLASQLNDMIDNHAAAKPVRLPVIPLLLRNAFFFSVVLYHGFRRLLPPY